MGVFKDALDALKDLSGTAKDAARLSLGSGKQYTSLHDRSLEGTLQFAHLVSRKLDIETAQMVCKASERALSTFVQIAMSMSPNLYVKDSEDVVDYIRQFHTNLLSTSATRNFKKGLAMALAEGYTGFIDDYNGRMVVTSVYNDKTTKLVIENKEQLYSVMEELNREILNKTVKMPELLSVPIKEAGPSTRYLNNVAGEVPARDIANAINQDIQLGMRSREIGIREKDADRTAAFREKDFRYRRQDSERDANLKSRDLDIKQQANRQRLRKDMDFDLNRNMLVDNDVKKSNELVSTLVHIRIQLISSETKQLIGIQDFTLGIKATMHPVTSEEMINNVVNAHRGNNTLFDFFRWTSGEISFAKDFLFNLSSIKQDVVNRSAGASPLWISAKRSRNLAKIYNKIGDKNLYPNMTIIMTKDEVDYVKDTYGIDLMNLRDVDKVIDALYLIDFIVVDTAAQICHFKFEAAQDWESVSFSGLEKENSRDERKFKEMLKALNRS